MAEALIKGLQFPEKNPISEYTGIVNIPACDSKFLIVQKLILGSSVK